MGDFSIQISSNLVSRLVDDTEKSKRKTNRTKRKVPPKSQSPQIKVHPKHISNESDTVQGVTPSPWPRQTPLFMPIIPPAHSANSELDSIQSVLQESERVVERLQKQEDNMVQEITQRAKDLHDKEFKLPYQKPMSCVTESDACFRCYKEHANDVLKCAHLVRNFADCNRRARQQVSGEEK